MGTETRLSIPVDTDLQVRGAIVTHIWLGERVLASSLQGGAKSELVNGLDELIGAHARGIECHSRLLVAEAHVRSLHPREPFQGSFDRNRSGPSGHPFNRQHDRRLCG